jgi:hypothetical protein
MLLKMIMPTKRTGEDPIYIFPLRVGQLEHPLYVDIFHLPSTHPHHSIVRENCQSVLVRSSGIGFRGKRHNTNIKKSHAQRSRIDLDTNEDKIQEGK